MAVYTTWVTATSIVRRHLTSNSMSELAPDGLLTGKQIETLSDRLDTLTIETAREFLGEPFIVHRDGTVLVEVGALLPAGSENMPEELNTYLADIDYDPCYKDL